MENVASILSGTSSRILARTRDPKPEPVPPPKLCFLISALRLLDTTRETYLDKLELEGGSDIVMRSISGIKTGRYVHLEARRNPQSVAARCRGCCRSTRHLPCNLNSKSVHSSRELSSRHTHNLSPNCCLRRSRNVCRYPDGRGCRVDLIAAVSRISILRNHSKQCTDSVAHTALQVNLH